MPFPLIVRMLVHDEDAVSIMGNALFIETRPTFDYLISEAKMLGMTQLLRVR